ncbi:hypothetical protein INR49_011670 [Caranx melampygus]|nr:hypothetical protein INR49_011670 [Caranx melampygus]
MALDVTPEQSGSWFSLSPDSVRCAGPHTPQRPGPAAPGSSREAVMLAVGQMDGSRQSAFLLSTPPLAALHSMTEMKTPLYPAYPLSSTGPNSSTSPATTSPNPAAWPCPPRGSRAPRGCPRGWAPRSSAPPPPRTGLTTSSTALRLRRRLHGHRGHRRGRRLLLRGDPVGAAPLQQPQPAAASRTYFSPSAAAVAVARYPKPLAELPGRTPIFWPGVMQSPHWRDARFACSPHQNSVLLDKDGKRNTPAHLLRAADLRPGENLRADQVPGGTGAGSAGLLPGHDGEPGQGVVPEQTDQVEEEARGGDGLGQEEAGLGDGAAEGRLRQRGRGRRLQQTSGPELGR